MKGIWRKTLKTYQNGKKRCHGKKLIAVVTLSLLLASVGVEAVYAQNIDSSKNQLPKTTAVDSDACKKADTKDKKFNFDIFVGVDEDYTIKQSISSEELIEDVNSSNFPTAYGSLLKSKNVNLGNNDDSEIEDKAVAIGFDVHAGSGAVAIGDRPRAMGNNEIAIGYNAGSIDGASGAISIGFITHANKQEAIALGSFANASSSSSIALGYDTKADGESAIAIGGKPKYYDGAKASGKHSISLGSASKTEGDKAIALGFKSEAIGEGSIAFGCESFNGKTKTEGSYSVSLGPSANTKGDYSISLGYNSKAEGLLNVALGPGAEANGKGAVSMGWNSKVLDGTGTSIAIGSNSIVEKNDIIDEEKLAEWKKDHQKYADFDIQSQDIIIKDSYRGDYCNGVVSFGSKGEERRLINVANGRVGAGSTDAINGGQLFGAVGYLEGRIDELKNNIGGNSITVEAGKGIKVEKDGNKYVISSDLEFGGDIGKPIDPTDEPSNSKVNNGKELDIVGGISDKDKLTNNNIGVVAGDDGKLHVQLGKDLQNIDSVQVNKEITVGDKVSITEAGVTVGDKVNISDGKISVGDVQISDGKVTGLNDGEISASSKDAVNGSQLHATNQKIDNITQDIDNINGRVNKLDGRVNKVGAGAAALAALHPLEFDPEEKLSFSAGMGNYKGETAAALGAFFRPNEKTIISMGGTVGNGENMVNLGISFALDKANKNKAAKVERDAEIENLRNQVAQLTALVNELVAERNK